MTDRRSNTSSDEIRQLSLRIFSYLTENPNARDTFEGILEWWILEQEIQRETRRVRQALERLVADGLVMEKRGPDGRVHYMIHPENREPGVSPADEPTEEER